MATPLDRDAQTLAHGPGYCSSRCEGKSQDPESHAESVAQLALTRAYREGNTLTVGCFAYSTVIFTMIFGVLIWGEILTLEACIGIAVIIVGGILAVFRRAAQTKQQR